MLLWNMKYTFSCVVFSNRLFPSYFPESNRKKKKIKGFSSLRVWTKILGLISLVPSGSHFHPWGQESTWVACSLLELKFGSTETGLSRGEGWSCSRARCWKQRTDAQGTHWKPGLVQAVDAKTNMTRSLSLPESCVNTSSMHLLKSAFYPCPTLLPQ